MGLRDAGTNIKNSRLRSTRQSAKDTGGISMRSASMSWRYGPSPDKVFTRLDNPRSQLGGGLLAGVALVGAGYYAYRSHNKSEEEVGTDTTIAPSSTSSMS